MSTTRAHSQSSHAKRRELRILLRSRRRHELIPCLVKGGTVGNGGVRIPAPPGNRVVPVGLGAGREVSGSGRMHLGPDTVVTENEASPASTLAVRTSASHSSQQRAWAGAAWLSARRAVCCKQEASHSVLASSWEP